MSFQDLYGNGGQLGMPFPQTAPGNSPYLSGVLQRAKTLGGSLASNGMSAMHALLPALFTGSQSSSATPAGTNAAPAPPAQPAAAPAMQPGQVTAPVPLPTPRPAGANMPMNIVPAQPNPTLNAGAPGGGSNGPPQPMPAMQQLVPQQGGGQQQGLFPKMMQDGQQFAKLFQAGGPFAGSLAGGGGGSVAGANALLAGLY